MDELIKGILRYADTPMLLLFALYFGTTLTRQMDDLMDNQQEIIKLLIASLSKAGGDQPPPPPTE